MRTSHVLRTLTKYHLSSTSNYIRPIHPSSQRGPQDPTGSSELDDRDFYLIPNFFNLQECKQLINMALWKLDRADTTLRRRKGKDKVIGNDGLEAEGDLQKLFRGDYGFEEGHYDSVIHDFRETLLSNFPPPSNQWLDLNNLMTRIYEQLPSITSTSISNSKPGPPSSTPSLSSSPDISPQTSLPPSGTSTHLLHLSPKGEILPHVDNVEASGKTIVGVSLGTERILRLKEKDGMRAWDVKLSNGSLYLQREVVRYKYEHSILGYGNEGSIWDGTKLEPGHRMSIMVRDAPSRNAAL